MAVVNRKFICSSFVKAIKWHVHLANWVVNRHRVHLVEQIDADEQRLVSKPKLSQEDWIVQAHLEEESEECHVNDIYCNC